MDMFLTIVFITAVAYLLYAALYGIRYDLHRQEQEYTPAVEEEPEPTRVILEAEKVARSQWRLHDKWERKGGVHRKDNR